MQQKRTDKLLDWSLRIDCLDKALLRHCRGHVETHNINHRKKDETESSTIFDDGSMITPLPWKRFFQNQY